VIIFTQIWTVQKGALESTAHIGFRTPPPVLPLTEGGGGPELVITWAHIWTAQNRALKSTVHIGFRTPPSVLPLMEGGGGGPEWVLKSALRSAARKPSTQINGSKWISDPPWCSAFNQRGGGGVRNRYFLRRAPCYMWHCPIGLKVPSLTCC
jgi:hypothetical protein